MTVISDQSSALSAIRLRYQDANPSAVLDAVERWAKDNDNKYVELSVRHARKVDALRSE